MKARRWALWLVGTVASLAAFIVGCMAWYNVHIDVLDRRSEPCNDVTHGALACEASEPRLWPLAGGLAGATLVLGPVVIVDRRLHSERT